MTENLVPIPEQIGKYKIEGLMTQGGMSCLYLGLDPATQEPIIIKVLRPKFLTDTDVVERFLNEARAIELANHPNIIKLIESGEWEGGLYIAMEFVKGSSLRKILQHQPYSLKRALEVLLQIAYALAHLHTHGVVHGDLKPENILINEQGQVKVIDFGIAQILTDDKKKGAERLIGTPIYMSPELLANPSSFSFQTDIYALGIIAYELSIGKISHGRVIISLAPKGLQKILHKALQPRPEDRYSDMCDFVADLAAYIKSGAYQKEKQGSDYFLEIFEKLERLQADLLTASPPSSKDYSLGIVYLQGMSLSGQYTDFFSLDDGRFAFFVAESKLKGAEAVVHACMLQSSIKTLIKVTNLKESLAFLKQLLDLSSSDFSFSYLVLNPQTMSFEYFQKDDYGQLLLTDSAGEKSLPIHPNSISGLSLKEFQGSYTKEDCFLFFGMQPQDDESIEAALKDALKEIGPGSAQSRSEAILRKVRMKAEKLLEEKPACLLLIQPNTGP